MTYYQIRFFPDHIWIIDDFPTLDICMAAIKGAEACVTWDVITRLAG